MSIKVICPICSALLIAPDDAKGKRGRCKKCQTVIMIPKANSVRSGSPEPHGCERQRLNPQESIPEPRNGAVQLLAEVIAESSTDTAPCGRCAKPTERKYRYLGLCETCRSELVLFFCVKCNVSLRSEQQNSGRATSCPVCKQTVTIPRIRLWKLIDDEDLSRIVNRAIATDGDELTRAIMHVVTILQDVGYVRHAELIDRLYRDGPHGAIAVLKMEFPDDRDISGEISGIEYNLPGKFHMDGSPMSREDTRAYHIGAINHVINRWLGPWSVKIW